ncbi:hypothetical protein HEQ62_10535 [Haematospirillum jordaniae]|uniref:Peptidase M10 serralysin C-terminal domain-containing protein n=1 Tax=Haematospirillum jordaniae TaxID=1549855 RepID=A0A145VQR2_9PROT|nr:M10 family metallopeptidase C-terminal domain-containing protein [Haematospirillum jordaniae]AMW35851.1 hypothetical protein AY555_10800 [Haematospirillum jordaniae]NKD46030.1 hypothetical protein [Haematospirillum jordaniae]NKD58096.1 hypothetical protein [Haematospirillum jordaniae]NKD60205.1 hypothetical protein [Haematospirillum jordaniae]NKD68095.1 hypothetical protein [Haematospirillum jordaniae]
MTDFTNTPGQKDTFVGTDNWDSVSYSNTDKPVQVTLRAAEYVDQARETALIKHLVFNHDSYGPPPDFSNLKPYMVRVARDVTVYVGGVAEDTLRDIESVTGGSGHDTLDGGDGNDTLDGGAGNDTLKGSAGNDRLYGGAGNDSLTGGTGNDTLDGGAGDDVADYGDKSAPVKVTLRGAEDATVYVNGVAEDTLRNIENVDGGYGNDELTGDANDNRLDGGAGDDTLSGGAGNDILSGGDGVDCLSGDDGEDTLKGGAGDDLLHGYAGADTLLGEDGDDRLYGGAGTDTLDGGTGDDTIKGGDGNDTLRGGEGNDTLKGDAGDDTLTGGAGADRFVFASAAETVGDVITDFKAGEDRIDLSGAGDLVFSEDGAHERALWTVVEGENLRLLGDTDGHVDSADINMLLQGVTSVGADAFGFQAALRSGVLDSGNQTGPVTLDLSSHPAIQKARGGAGDDRITGNARDNHLQGGTGADVLVGGAGSDVLDGGAGADTLTGGSGADRFVFASAAETVGDVITDFEAGEDRIDLSGAGDLVFSEDGPRAGALWTVAEGENLRLRGDTDGDATTAEVDILLSQASHLGAADVGATVVARGTTLDATSATAAVTLDLAAFAGTDTAIGGAGDDTILGTEGDDTLSGGAGDDTLTGDEGHDVLTGGAGHDELTGGDGDDTLTGGADGDRLTGGAGADRFVYTTAAETRGDVITDFTVGEDRIDLSAVGDFVFSVEGPRARSLWTARDENGLHLRGDTDGDAKTAEVDLTLSGVESLKSFDLGLMPVWGNALDVSTSEVGVTADMRRHADIASMTGGRGDDVFTGTSGKNALFGQDGNDTLDGHEGDDSLYGGAGADRLTGGAGHDRFVYTTAAETRGDVITDFKAGEDRIDLSAVGEFAFSEGGPRARSLWLRRGEDGSMRLLGDTDGNADTAEVDLHLGVVESLTTHDLGVTTRIAGDMIDAGLATDSVELHVTDWTGVRKARGGAGADVLTGNDRNNHLYGQGGDDRLYGRDMDDHLDGGDGDDRLYGEGGDDTLEGEAGNDTLEGGDGNDNLKGGSGDDLLQGEKGNDVLEGGTGHDTLEGGAGSDALDGGDGDDVLRGGEGADTLTGGAGSDRFVYNTVSETTGDRITDFTSGEDRLDMSALGAFTFSKEGPRGRRPRQP